MEFLLLLLALCGFVAYEPAAHICLFLIHFAGALWVAWRLVPRQPLSALFVLLYIGMYIPNPIAVLMDWLPLEPGIAEDVLYQSNVLVMLGLDLFIIGARRLRLTRFDVNRIGEFRLGYAPTESVIAVTLLFCAAMVGGMIVLLFAMGTNPFTVEKVYRAVGGGLQTPVYLSTKFALFALPLAVFLIGLKRIPGQAIYAAPIALLLLLHFLTYRTRTLLITVLLAWIVAQVARSFFVSVGAVPVRRRLPLALKLVVGVGIPSLVLVGVSLKYARYAYTVKDYSYDQKRMEFLLGHTFAGGDLGYTTFLREAMVRFPSSVPYLYGQSYYRILLIPIPRAIWSGKPHNTQRVFADALDPALGRTGTTIPPGIVGDLYINFGPLGVVGMVAFGAFFARERYRQFSDLLFLAGSGTWLIHLVRGGFTNPLVTMVVMWALCIAISRLLAPAHTGYARTGSALRPTTHPRRRAWPQRIAVSDAGTY